MKKRFPALILALALVMTLTACGGGAPAPTATPAPPTATIAPTAEPTPTPEPEPEFSLGYYSEDGASYINDFAGITFTLPQDWVFATQQELENIMGAGSEAVFGDDATAALEYAKNSTVYDMMAGTVGGSSNLMVMLENLASYLGGTTMDEDDYIEALSQGLLAVEGISYQLGEVTDAELGGEAYRVLTVTVPDYALEQSYYVRRVGSYMLCLCLTNGSALGEGGLAAYIG